MTFQGRLFGHINSLWLRNLYNMTKTDPKNHIAQRLYGQIQKSLPQECSPDLWEEGYRIGHAIDANYKANEVFELPALSFLKDVDDKPYIEYLGSNLHAWAVPLSYHYLLTGRRVTLDKQLNLWGSTQSHKKYFKTLIDMIVNYLKRSESRLPVGFIDVGCGDGSLLRDLKTALSSVFDNSFIFIGFDLDEQSHRIAEQQGHEEILFLGGDVAKPQELNASLISKGFPSLDQFFHVRAFVDHNSKPFCGGEYKEDETNISSYYYVHNNTFISQKFVEDSFQTHFARWEPFIRRHGLGIIELHKSEGYSLTKSPAIAYEIFHLLSEQYMMSYLLYANSWLNAGLTLLDIKLIPNHILDPNISISIYR